MIRALIPVAVIVLSACSSPEGREQQAMMDLIEAKVRLPGSAEPLSRYARYYADMGDGTVKGVYLVFCDDAPRPGEACEELAADGSSRVVPCPDFRPDWQIPAGDRTWLADRRKLPGINDGGCMEVDVIFDRAKSEVVSVVCNGAA